MRQWAVTRQARKEQRTPVRKKPQREGWVGVTKHRLLISAKDGMVWCWEDAHEVSERMVVCCLVIGCAFVVLEIVQLGVVAETKRVMLMSEVAAKRVG